MRRSFAIGICAAALLVGAAVTWAQPAKTACAPAGTLECRGSCAGAFATCLEGCDARRGSAYDACFLGCSAGQRSCLEGCAAHCAAAPPAPAPAPAPPSMAAPLPPAPQRPYVAPVPPGTFRIDARGANGITAAVRGLPCGPEASDAMARHLLRTCGTLPLQSLQELDCRCWAGSGSGPVCEMRAIGQCAMPAAAPPPAWGSGRGYSVAMFRTMFGVSCGDHESRVQAVLGPPASRVAAGVRSVLQYGAVSMQIVAATGRVAYIAITQSAGQPLDPRFLSEPKLRYLGWPASAVMQEFGPPKVPSDAVMYQDDAAQVMVSFYCPQGGQCTNIGIYCLGS